MAGADRYRAQLTESAHHVATRLGSVNWALVFQSRSGRPEDAWLGPDVCDYLRAERAKGLEAAVLCPIGFVCDHIEVLYYLDREAAEVCREIGVTMARAEAVNDDPLFLDLMTDAVMQTWKRYRTGTPLSLAPAAPLAPSASRPPHRVDLATLAHPSTALGMTLSLSEGQGEPRGKLSLRHASTYAEPGSGKNCTAPRPERSMRTRIEERRPSAFRLMHLRHQLETYEAAAIAPNSAGEIVPAFICAKPSMAL